MITAFFHRGGRGTGHAGHPRCPSAGEEHSRAPGARRTVVTAMQAGFMSTAAAAARAAGASQPDASGSAAGRIVLVAVAVVAVGAFAMLHVMARSRRDRPPSGRRRRPPDVSDWRTLARRYQDAAGDDEPLSGHEAHYPAGRRYGYPPDYDRDLPDRH
jgi:hypothetical protein